MKEIVDTRFLVEHFVSADPNLVERARERMREIRRTKRGVLPTIALAEFFAQVCRHGGQAKARTLVRALLSSGIPLQPLTTSIALAAGAYRCSNPDVPLADCIIAATAAEHRGLVISDDPHFRRLAKVRVDWI